MAKEKVCIVENDPIYSQLLSDQLNLDNSLELIFFIDGKSLLENLTLNPFCIFLSVSYSNTGAEELIRRIREYNPDIQIVLLCTQQEKDIYKQYLKMGVREHLIKDRDIKTSAVTIMARLEYISRILKENAVLKEQVFTEHLTHYASSPGYFQEKPVQVFIHKAASNKLPVLLRAVLGGQPELLARQIHLASNRAAFPFAKIDLQKIPKDQVNRVLFHKKSPKSKQSEELQGILMKADGGSVFIDHLELLSLKQQDKIMKFIARNAYRSRGKAEIFANVRFIFATYTDPQILIKEGKMLPFFFEKLRAATFKMIPLKDRPHEIPALAENYLEEYCKENRLKPKNLSPKAAAKLMIHSYPEDLSELSLILQRAVTLSASDIISEEAIQFMESYFNPDLSHGNNSPLELKIKMVNHSLKMHNNKVALVAKELKIGKSSIYRMREKGLISF